MNAFMDQFAQLLGDVVIIACCIRVLGVAALEWLWEILNEIRGLEWRDGKISR